MRMIPILRMIAITIIAMEEKMMMKIINTIMTAMGIAESVIDWLSLLIGTCKCIFGEITDHHG